MKNTFTLITLLSLFTVAAQAQTNTFPSTGAAGIGTTTPNASSLLDVVSTTKGILVPRMTKTERDAIASPASGLLIYQTNQTPGFYYYSGTAWIAVSSKGADKSLSNLTAPTAVNLDLLPGTDNTINLGSAGSGWRDVYATGSYLIGGSKVLNIAGTGNTFVGATGNTTNSGTDNTATGFEALFSNTTWSGNTATGFNALFSNTTGSTNTATGRNSLFSNTTGFHNTATGLNALLSNTTGSSNTANGKFALRSNTTGNFNTALGDSANVGSGNLTNATAIGSHALVSASNSLVLGSISGVNGATSGVNVGIGTSTPAKKLHVMVSGGSGGTPQTNAGMVLENSATTYLQFLTPDASEKGILFGDAASATDGGIIYNSSNAMQFRTNGNVTQMSLSSSGQLAIGTAFFDNLLRVGTTTGGRGENRFW